MLSEKAWAFIVSRRRLSWTIGVLALIFLALFIPWLFAEGYLLDLQSRIDGKHETRISNFQHVFHEDMVLGTDLGDGSAVAKMVGIEVLITNTSTPRSRILNQTWLQWDIPNNYTLLVVTINTSTISLANLTVSVLSGNDVVEGPLEIPPGLNATMVIKFDELKDNASFIILFESTNAVVFDVWAEPAGDMVSPPTIVLLMRRIYGTFAPPIVLLLATLLGYLGYLLARFYYVGWKLEKTRGYLARFQWEKEQLGLEEDEDTQ